MKTIQEILLAFYGDDFTGSTDSLEFLSRAGAKTVLFIEPPTSAQLFMYPWLDAYGVAGMSRSLTPLQMEEILLPAFEMILQSEVQHVHYKTCSTFDSSPTIGSIGKAIDIGVAVFTCPIVPLLVAAPTLGRYCLFGNLFARMGIGSNGEIYRLDRHPSMSQHPVTPSDESDLRLHLAKQTSKKIGLIDILQLEKGIAELNDINATADIVLLDALYDEQLLKIGAWIDAQRKNEMPLFSVGSSAIEVSLGKLWNEKQLLHPVTDWLHPGKASSLLVLSGSCSPVTAAQILWAKANGFCEVILDPILFRKSAELLLEPFITVVTDFIQRGMNVIVHTGDKQPANLPSKLVGTALGLIAKEIVIKEGIQRVLIAGGDTSSYAARAMDILAVEMIAPLVPGSPLCKVISENKAINGLEVNFKGGQVGNENYFEEVLNGEVRF